MQYIEFDSTPYEEDCVQVRTGENYMPAMRAQANRMIEMLEARFPDAPGYFSIKSCPHDFGSYLEIRYCFEGDDGWGWANFIEDNWPSTWGDTQVLNLTIPN